MRLPTVLLAWILLVLPAGPVLAAPGSMGAHLGFAKARDTEKGNGTVGAHLEIGLLPWLGVQGSLDYRLVETLTVQTGTTQGELDVRSVPLTASARVYLPLPGTLRPFAVAGAGWYFLVYDYSQELEIAGTEDESENTFGWHVGAGLEVAVSPRVSLYGEGRGVFVDPDQALDEALFDQIEEFDYDSFYLAGGINFHF